MEDQSSQTNFISHLKTWHLIKVAWKMAAWLADNSFSWSKLKKSITAVWKCNASTLEPHITTKRHQAKRRGARRGRRAPPMCHIWTARLQSLSRQPVTGSRAWKGPRAGMKPQISRAASTNLNLLVSALTHPLTFSLADAQKTQSHVKDV